MDERPSFGSWLRQRRKTLRLTQEELAERMACSSAMVRKIESGERVASQQMAELLAESFGIAASERLDFIQFAQGRLSEDEAKRALWQTPHTAQDHPTNLAVPLTVLIGREQELETLRNLLLRDGDRLITLTGPPGIGKTRLSLQLGMEMLDHFRDGVFFVGLASVVDPDLVAATIANALDLSDKGNKPDLTGLQRALSSKRLLLILDNIEQVLDASPIVVDLLGLCPDLKVLITSREALHVHGERQYRVPVLATADPTSLPPIHILENIPAIALFVERAQAVKSDFALTEQNSGAIAAICRRLDGLPLAIELAGARIRLLSPGEMQTRLDSRLLLLTGGPRNLPARQQTLRAAIDWSYNLLNADEQTLFARMSVFVGGCTLSAAESVCNPGIGYQVSGAMDDNLPTLDTRHLTSLQIEVSAGIESLLDKNLLKREDGINGESRFTMLELIGEYSSSKLHASGEESDTRALHTQYFLALAETARPHLFTGEQQLWLRKLEADQDNLRAILGRSLADGGDVEIAARIGVAIWRFWEVYGYLREGRGWLERILNNGGSLPDLLREGTLNALGIIAANQGDYAVARGAYEEGLGLARKSPDTDYNGNLHFNLAQIVIEQGEYEYAGALLEEALGIVRTSNWRAGLAFCLDHLGLIRANLGDYGQAKLFYDESLLLRREIGDHMFTGMTLCNLGDLARYQAEFDTAAQLYAEALDLFQELGDKRSISYALTRLALIEMSRENPERSRSLQEKALSPMRELGDREMIAFSLAGLAALAALEGRVEQSIRLFAQSETLLQSITAVMRPAELSYFGHIISATNAFLDEDAYARVQAEGREMTMEQAIEYAADCGITERQWTK